MRILLTAFEPFDGSGLNASLEGCRAYLASDSAPEGLCFAVLPVEYGADTLAVERVLAEGPVDVLLHTGQGGGAALRVERIAVNARYALPSRPPGLGEAERRELAQQRIEEAGPAGLFATIPVERTVAAIRAADVPAVVSNHAGIYLCNHVLYRSLRRAERQGDVRVGFLHVPRLPEQVDAGAPSLAAHEIGRAVGAALAFLTGRLSEGSEGSDR